MKNYSFQEAFKNFKKAFSRKNLINNFFLPLICRFFIPLFKFSIFLTPLVALFYFGWIKYPCLEKIEKEYEFLSRIPLGWKFIDKTFTFINDNVTKDREYITSREKGTIFIYENINPRTQNSGTYLVFESNASDGCSKSEAYLMAINSLNDVFNGGFLVQDGKLYQVKLNKTYINWWFGYLFLAVYLIIYLVFYSKISRYLFGGQRSDKTEKVSHFFIYDWT